MQIIKASGKKEEFEPLKIQNTIMQAGASEKLAKDVLKKILDEYKDKNKVQSKAILNKIIDLLQEKNPDIAARYDLKRAIMNLGPSGFPFEVYFSKILENHGYQVKVGQILQGKNITQEVDIVAENKLRYMIECKYHNKLGIHTKVNVAMHTYARFLDLKNQFDYPWLATNTKCTTDLISYANGINMKITSWQYPKKENLKALIEEKALYPITIIRSIDESSKQKLHEADIVLAKDLALYDIEELKIKTKLSKETLKIILKEAKMICKFRGEKNE
ncbi:MAG: restriction endonuclease [archaeon GW2011_AR13]|nr:MAG: restriction endonuclease [archaeon GW2011_AR13]HIG94532.1 hypothetical protein [Nanoarchaeota archaeon]HIH63031.1 hypothetical protein [Nanoarchaeota archaeon]HIJ09542.1 hypothetical protein [Nanoarchaeota archaeon]